MRAFLESLSPSTVRLSAAVATAVIAAVALAVIELRFRRSVRAAAIGPEARRPAIGALTLAVRERYIVKKSGGGFVGAPGPFPELPFTLGYPARWLQALRDSGSRSAAGRLLRFAPDLGLFDCFDSALRHAGVRKVLLAWMGAQGDGFTLRRIALSGPGREFDGAAAKSLLAWLVFANVLIPQ